MGTIELERHSEVLKIAVGLVVKGGKEFIDGWIESAEKVADEIFVIDNGADKEVKDKLINHPLVKQYHIQHFSKRNMSRDYAKVLNYAREEKCHWVWIMDIDKYIASIDILDFKHFLMNTKEESIGFPLFEMRGDKEHYVAVIDYQTGDSKDARLSHECYKVLSHFEYDVSDEHSGVIPQNCKPGDTIAAVPIKHFGHMTAELRDEKRQKYIKDKKDYGYDDKGELKAVWMEEDYSKITIKDFSKIKKIIEDMKSGKI